jgi:hypothetical protein
LYELPDMGRSICLLTPFNSISVFRLVKGREPN